LPLLPEADVGRPVSATAHGSSSDGHGNSNNEHYRASSPSTIVPMIGDETNYSTTARKGFPSSAYGDEHENALLSSGAGGGSGSRYADSDHRQGRADIDNDENKYKRRSAFEWFRRWLSSNSVPAPKRKMVGGHWSWKRILFYTFLCVVAILTLVTVLGRMARSSAESDPFLDPMANPNIRVADVPENS